ncbi:hypothetical protein PQR64_32780 [Paraburkholderia phytofirmans]|uniref:hypothetical protein n=1 Tax=Paraburkholderia phytofirmans TaxID=261302 RepID=UPI0038B86B3F
MERVADANGAAYLQANGPRSDGAAVEFLSDYPRTSDREKQNQRSRLGETALTPQERAAVRSMCGEP